MNPRRTHTAVFAGLCLLVALLLGGAYANSFRNEFHFDDSHVVSTNLYIRSLNNIPRFFRDAMTFSSLPANATYRPLVTTTLAIDYWLGGGLAPAQYHVTQLVMLGALGVLVYWLFVRVIDTAAPNAWNRFAALAATAIFLLHPTNTETMNLIHARSELLSAIGVVGAFLIYLYLPATRRFHLYLVPMLLGALAKTPSVIFAPLLVVYITLFEERLSVAEVFAPAHRGALLRTLRRCLPALIVGAIVFYAVEAQNGEAATYGGGSRWQYLQTQLFVWLHYTRLFFLPLGLTTDTDWTLIAAPYDTRVVAGALFIGLLVRLLWTTSRTPALRPVTFGLAWYALTLLPASSIFPLAEVVNEHRVFQPYIGLALAVVAALVEAAQRFAAARPAAAPQIAAALAVVTIAATAAEALGTYERNTVYATEETLWRDVVAKSPGNGRAWMNYGLSQMTKGDYVEAKRLFERALVLSPNYGTLEVNLGIASGALGDHVAAERHFQRALQLQPDDPNSHFFYARWLGERQRLAEAIPHLQRTIALSPARIDARHLLMDVYARAGQVDASIALARETLAAAPGDVFAQRYANTPTVAPAAAGATPTTTDEWMNLSLARYQSRDFAGSIAAARQALTLSPNLAEGHNNIAAASAALGKWDDAIVAAREALRLKPDFPLARNNLAWAESEKRKLSGGQ